MKSIKLIIGVLTIFFTNTINAQSSIKIGGDVGRAYYYYKFQDYGQGAKNLPSANYGFTAELTITKELDQKKIIESGLRFILYEQYYSTRLYNVSNEQNYPVLYLPVYFGYKISKSRFSFVPKGGVLLGFMLNPNESQFYSDIFTSPTTTDSLSRGFIYRNLATVFPLLSVEFDLSYKIASNFESIIKFSGAKGFIRITEFDIYYNDGSGKNDQRAKQWGYGDYASVSVGFRYLINQRKTK